MGALPFETRKRSSRGARTLPGEYHTSPEVYARESERIFDRRWLCAGPACRIPEAGDFLVCEIEGESLLVVRGEDGAVRGFYNVCRHRGARLCGEPLGHAGPTIVCPYHSWAYACDGRLAAAPNMADAEGFERDEHSLHPVATGVWEGLVFVSLAPDPEPFAQAYAPLEGKFTAWRIPELRVVHSLEYEIKANWKLLFQNYSECYHCPTLHPLLNRLSPYRNSYSELEQGPFLGGPMRMAMDGGSMTVTGRACAAPLRDVAGEERNLVYYYTLFPNLFLSLHPDYVLLHRLYRLDPRRTRLVCEWLFHPDAIATPAFDPSGAIEFWSMTNDQDWHICEAAQIGVASRAFTPGPYANLESTVAAFDRHYLEVHEGRRP